MADTRTPDAIALLKQDHREVEDLFEKMLVKEKDALSACLKFVLIQYLLSTNRLGEVYMILQLVQ